MSKKEEDLEKILNKFLEAITLLQGNDLTHFQGFQRLMLEERINILADAVTLLLGLKLDKLHED